MSTPAIESIGFAIVGCGRIGQRHAGHAPKFGRLTGVCDTVPDLVAKVAQAQGARAFGDYDEMLASDGSFMVDSICER